MADDSICKYCRHYKTKKLNGRVVSEYCSANDVSSCDYVECDWFDKKLIVWIKEFLRKCDSLEIDVR